MSEHIYDAITQERRDGKHEDDRLNAMIGVLVMKLMKKEIITMDEGVEIMCAENLFEEINKEAKK
jgi:hypothetical protein